MAHSFRDKVVLITGASKGIGRACAVNFASQGANVAITARSKDDLQETVNRMKIDGNKVLAFPADITDRTQVKSVINEVIDAFGSIDVLVNNAGQNISGAIEDLDTAKLDYIFRLNIFGSLWFMQEVIPR